MNAARISLNNRTTGEYLVIFGFDLRDGSFQVSHAKPSRTYKSEKAAIKAAAAWTA